MKRTLTLLAALVIAVPANAAQIKATGYWLPYQANKVFEDGCDVPPASLWRFALWTGYGIITRGTLDLDCGGARLVYYTAESPYGKFQ